MKWLSRVLLPAIVAIAAPALALAQTVEPVREGDRTLGSAADPVTLTVYLSTTCSHCADWHTNDFPAFKARWVDTGRSGWRSGTCRRSRRRSRSPAR